MHHLTRLACLAVLGLLLAAAPAYAAAPKPAGMSLPMA